MNDFIFNSINAKARSVTIQQAIYNALPPTHKSRSEILIQNVKQPIYIKTGLTASRAILKKM